MSKLHFLPHDHLPALLDGLRAAGYAVVGPQCRDGAIVYARLDTAADLPYGVSDRQQPGRYRLVPGHGVRAFAWANGPQALKPMLFAARETLWRAQRDANGQMHFDATLPAPEPTAVIGVRACDLAALALQDQHFLHCSYPDPYYRQRRESLFIVAVHCGHPADSCFCASTGDGPRAEHGFDLAIGELDDGFVLQVGSDRGQQIVDTLDLLLASPEQCRALDDELAQAARQQRALPGRDLQQSLFANLQHPRWDEVGARCLGVICSSHCLPICSIRAGTRWAHAACHAVTVPRCARPAFATASRIWPRWMALAASISASGAPVSPRGTAISMASPSARRPSSVIASGSPTSWAVGTSSMGVPAAWAAGVASVGARSAST